MAVFCPSHSLIQRQYSNSDHAKEGHIKEAAAWKTVFQVTEISVSDTKVIWGVKIHFSLHHIQEYTLVER